MEVMKVTKRELIEGLKHVSDDATVFVGSFSDDPYPATRIRLGFTNTAFGVAGTPYLVFEAEEGVKIKKEAVLLDVLD
jgi:hypothetical protein